MRCVAFREGMREGDSRGKWLGLGVLSPTRGGLVVVGRLD